MIEYCFPESILVYKFIKNIASCRRGEKMYIEIIRLDSTSFFAFISSFEMLLIARALQVSTNHEFTSDFTPPFPPLPSSICYHAIVKKIFDLQCYQYRSIYFTTMQTDK